ncbi:MAG: MBL fold metallo-hydrolase [Candidatus Altiarchaeota archaeon]|nr:MBL fold metallo-hydrolase [Candidatus Altiarchaeota archaeon]
MELRFCGAAGIVTGSCFLVEAGGNKVIVDCGMFQGPKEITRLNYEPFVFDPTKISHVFLTHAHIDHSGLIPKLVAQGFRGQILATSATIDLCRIMLEDSAEMHVSETKKENKRRKREGLELRQPLYTKREVEGAMSLFKEVSYDREYKATDNISVRYRDAGHIIGSAIIEMSAEEDGKKRKIVFSGDIGQRDAPIVKDPTVIEDADYLLVESTYGDRLHEDPKERGELLLKHAKETYRRGGKLMIPSFAVERTQELLYTINKLIERGEFPNEKVFLDSPLAMKATEVFNRHREFFDEETNGYVYPFGFKDLVYLHKTEDSMMLNTYNKPCIIIAGSGMCTGGRIRHHFRHGIWDPKNTVLFVGYQAKGTLGRVIVGGGKRIRMMGMEVDVRANIRKIDAFSAHADYKDLVWWCKGFKKRPKKVFIVHGEPDSSASLKQKLEREGFRCYTPSMNEGVEI